LIAQAKELSKDFLLPQCMQTLLIQVHQTAVISMYNKLSLQQVMAPLFDRHDDSKILLISRQTLIAGC
jgi:hypothetical protein